MRKCKDAALCKSGGGFSLNYLLFSFTENETPPILRGQLLFTSQRNIRHCLNGRNFNRCLTHKELMDYLDVYYFNSRCDLVECMISCHLKWTKMIFHLRMCLNQNTFWLQRLPAEWAPSSVGSKCFQFAWCQDLFALFKLYL